MKNLFYPQTNKLAFQLLVIMSLILTHSSYGEDNKTNKVQPIEKNNILQESKNQLLPLPIIDFESAILKVNNERNPFHKPSDSEITATEDLYSTLRFKGLASSNNLIYAIIETGDKQKFYKVGDTLDNGFFVTSISIDDISVDISNGSNDYRLSLTKFKKSL